MEMKMARHQTSSKNSKEQKRRGIKIKPWIKARLQGDRKLRYEDTACNDFVGHAIMMCYCSSGFALHAPCSLQFLINCKSEP